jgi:hypothetical protein
VKDFEGEPGEVGFRFAAVYKVMGRRLESRSEITRSEMPRFIEETGNMPGGGDVISSSVLEPTADGGTAVTFTMDYQLGSSLLAGIADRLAFERAIERDVRQSSENLKSLAEAEIPITA